MAARSKAPVAEPEATVEVHYVGPGDAYVIGFTTDPTVTQTVRPDVAEGLIGTGLFAAGPATETATPPTETPATPGEE